MTVNELPSREMVEALFLVVFKSGLNTAVEKNI